MSADIIQFVPRPNPNRERELERQAMEIMNIAFPVVHIEIPFGGQGIDGMFTDTSCSEINPDKPA